MREGGREGGRDQEREGGRENKKPLNVCSPSHRSSVSLGRSGEVEKRRELSIL